MKSFLKTILISTLLFSSSVKVFAQDVMILKTEFFRKGILSLESCEDFMSGDSTFLLKISWLNPDTSHKVTAVWCLSTEDGKQSYVLDSTQFLIKDKPPTFTIGYTRTSFSFLPAFYYVNLYIDDKFHRKIEFKVFPEEIISSQYFVVNNNTFIPVTKIKTGDLNIGIRIFLEKEIIPDDTEIETVWFFELPGDEPIFLHEQKGSVKGDINFMEFYYQSQGYWAEGHLVVEVWLDKKFQKFFRIEVID